MMVTYASGTGWCCESGCEYCERGTGVISG